jgi:hypothetical protein
MQRSNLGAAISVFVDASEAILSAALRPPI